MKTIVVLSLIALLIGCANYQPIVDTKGVDMLTYHGDLLECQQYATEIDPAARAAASAAAGAVIGAVIGAIFGNRHTAGQGAAAYGLLGGAGGGAQGAMAQREIIIRCMAGRGYKVLQ